MEEYENRKIFQMIGLAKRAGKAASGSFSARMAVQKRQAFLVIIAQDASFRTRKRFEDMCRFRSIPCHLLGTKETLGKYLGEEERSVAAVTDPSFAEAILRLFPAS